MKDVDLEFAVNIYFYKWRHWYSKWRK